jgi:parallel beta-helix repeat protein
MDGSGRFESKAMTLTLLLLLLMPNACTAFFIRTVTANTTWTVDDDGPGLRSIQDAIYIASDGDTIMVLAGTYYEHLIISKRLSIIGENQNSTIIDGGDSGTVASITSNGITIKGFTIQHGDVGTEIADKKEGNILLENNIVFNRFWGIYGDRCGENVIANNNVSFNGWDGMYLYASEPCLLVSNVILSHPRAGVFIRYSSNNTVVGNLVSNNTIGIYVYSDTDPLRASALAKNNVFTNNHVLNNSYGIEIEHLAVDMTPAKNEVHDNLIAYNGLGLSMFGSNGNSIYHNNFVNNSDQVSIYDSSNNTWDAGYYSGGNYWSDHNSTDLNWGPGQNETGSDGVVDTPYLASANPGEKDKYPFIHTDGWLASPELTIVSPSNKTYRSNTLLLVLTMNKPAQLSYSLDNQTELTVDRNLNLTDLSIGAHSVTVHANDTEGNKTSSEVQFTITFLGDINLDGAVNIIDISIVAYSFGSTPDSERWNSIVDLDNNGRVNILDISIVAKEYGRRM